VEVSGLDAVALVAAGTVAGLVGSAGGITSMVSYPALLAVGLPPLPAGVANNVALVACWPGSGLASRPELRGRAGWLRRALPITLAGGVLGAALLLVTPAGAFERIVPFLVALGALTLLAEPRLTAWRARRARERSGAVAIPAGLFMLSSYNGYFGAGSGVMTLTLLLMLVDPDLPTANALKNMAIGAASIASAVVFVAAGPVSWRFVLPLALGLLAGSSLGPCVARRMPAGVLRVAIAVLGLALAVQLWVSAS
jgi:uncharacterized protein